MQPFPVHPRTQIDNHGHAIVGVLPQQHSVQTNLDMTLCVTVFKRVVDVPGLEYNVNGIPSVLCLLVVMTWL